MSDVGTSGWFGVRCLFEHWSTAAESDDPHVYEERITVWRARDLDDAIARAEAEAETFAEMPNTEFLGLVQAYRMFDDLTEGAEVFSLMRVDALPAEQYLNAFFTTGGERQQEWQQSEGEA